MTYTLLAPVLLLGLLILYFVLRHRTDEEFLGFLGVRAPAAIFCALFVLALFLGSLRHPALPRARP